jgi:hypothetical protein
MHSYENPQCFSVKEFESDLQRFEYINKLFKRYKEYNDLKERLILNHIIVLYNVFGDNATFMLLHKINQEYIQALLVFLIYLNRLLPSSETGPLDQNIIDNLRNL